MQVSDHKAVLSPMHSVFLELEAHHCHLNFKQLDEDDNTVIPEIFNLQLLNKLLYMILTKQVKLIQILTLQILLEKLTEVEAYLLDENEVRERIAKKMRRFNTFTTIVVTSLIASAVITGGISIAAFASGIGLPVSIALRS